jgi:hypothetical protein
VVTAVLSGAADGVPVDGLGLAVISVGACVAAAAALGGSRWRPART